MSERQSKADKEEAVEETTEETQEFGPGEGPAFVQPPKEEAPPDVPAGHVLVTYTGFADLIEVGGLQFRPGQPVVTPSDVAESLQKLTGETFAIVTKE